MLAEAKDIGEVLHVHSMAAAAEEYAKAEKLGDVAERHAREIRVRAGRRAGEVLREMAAAGERFANQPGINSRAVGTHEGDLMTADVLGPFTLSDIGITPSQSSRWQRLATLSPDEFEQRVKQGWGEDAIARGFGRGTRRRLTAEPTAAAKNVRAEHGVSTVPTLMQSLRGLQQAAVQLQGLAEALDGRLLGDWSRLYSAQEAQVLFQTLADSLPVVAARIKRELREWRNAANGTERHAHG